MHIYGLFYQLFSYSKPNVYRAKTESKINQLEIRKLQVSPYFQTDNPLFSSHNFSVTVVYVFKLKLGSVCMDFTYIHLQTV